MDDETEEHKSNSDKCPLLHKENTFDQYSYTSLGSVQDDSGNEDGSDSEGPGHGRGSATKETVRLYNRRFYILTLFSLIAIVQGLVWNTWSPISQSAKRVFHWSDGDVALLADWGPITYVISMVFFSWLLDTKGLKVSCLVCSFLLAGGTGIRCITEEQPWANWLMHSGQILNGFAGPIAMAGCTVISAVWFPPNQRTTATSIGAMCNVFGVAVSFLIGPLLVPQHRLDCNMTQLLDYNESQTMLHSSSQSGNYSDPGCGNVTAMKELLGQERLDVMKLLYIEFGIAGSVFLATLLYFPAKPPHPPSITATVDRADFKAGVMSLLKNRHFWLISLVYGLSIGIENTWMSVLDINFNKLGVSQDQAGWMGFYATVAGTIGAMVVARFADTFAKHMKVYLLVLYALSSGAFIWIALMFIQVAPFQTEYLYIAVVLGGLCLNSAVPLLYELSCEITFPVSEGVTSGALTLYFNISALVFLSVMMIPNIGDSWTTWSVPGTIFVCIPMLLIVKEKYNRLNMDIEVESPKENARRPDET
ncbi:solute carrier family 49 member 4 homolog [Liolophura sinensis]|uniref:solute carrier family 49 member 4 homolog n=1 Tax=Liolophura sinensis TaxID=3198878 RepID=UPI00315896B0